VTPIDKNKEEKVNKKSMEDMPRNVSTALTIYGTGRGGMLWNGVRRKGEDRNRQRKEEEGEWKWREIFRRVDRKRWHEEVT